MKYICKRNKKNTANIFIAVFIISILFLIGGLIPSTFAYFNDSQSITNNSLSTGILNFEIYTPKTRSISNIFQINLENTGTLPLTIKQDTISQKGDCNFFDLKISTNKGTLPHISLLPKEKITLTYNFTSNITNHPTKDVLNCISSHVITGWQSNFDNPNNGFVVKKYFNFNIYAMVQLIPLPSINNSKPIELEMPLPSQEFTNQQSETPSPPEDVTDQPEEKDIVESSLPEDNEPTESEALEEIFPTETVDDELENTEI